MVTAKGVLTAEVPGRRPGAGCLRALGSLRFVLLYSSTQRRRDAENAKSIILLRFSMVSARSAVDSSLPVHGLFSNAEVERLLGEFSFLEVLED